MSDKETLSPHRRTSPMGTRTPFNPTDSDDNLCVITLGNKKIQFYLDPNPGKTDIQTNIGGYKVHISNRMNNRWIKSPKS